jgi:hypothetical protein
MGKEFLVGGWRRATRGLTHDGYPQANSVILERKGISRFEKYGENQRIKGCGSPSIDE